VIALFTAIDWTETGRTFRSENVLSLINRFHGPILRFLAHMNVSRLLRETCGRTRGNK